MDGNAHGKVVINLATGMEDPERVMVAFLVGGAAAEPVRGSRRSLSRLPILLQHTQARRGRPRRARGDWWRDPPLAMDR